MNACCLALVGVCILTVAPSLAVCAEPGAPEGIESEQSLPSRYAYVADDVVKFCQPKKGFWVDLGAGQGGLAIALVEITRNPVVMLDPNAESLAEALKSARAKGLEDRLSAVVGRAEAMPFPDNSVDLMASRGSIFFWDDPVKGLKEVHRVLRPGGRAYIGGGAGSGYPSSAVEQLMEGRRAKMRGDEAEKWKRFVELRRPEQMKKWAADAGLQDFEVMGQGAISDQDKRVGQGVWLLFQKKPDSAAKPPN